MNTQQKIILNSLGILLVSVSPAFAYVGPGAGLSAIGSVLAFLGVIVLMIVGFFWYPMKRMFAGRRENLSKQPSEDSSE